MGYYITKKWDKTQTTLTWWYDEIVKRGLVMVDSKKLESDQGFLYMSPERIQLWYRTLRASIRL